MDSNYSKGSLIGYYQKFFTERAVQHCNRLLREVVDSQSLESFIGHVDVVLTDMVSGGRLGCAGLMVGPNDPKGIFQSKQFHDFKGQDLGRRLEEPGHE